MNARLYVPISALEPYLKADWGARGRWQETPTARYAACLLQVRLHRLACMAIRREQQIPVILPANLVGFADAIGRLNAQRHSETWASRASSRSVAR